MIDRDVEILSSTPIGPVDIRSSYGKLPYVPGGSPCNASAQPQQVTPRGLVNSLTGLPLTNMNKSVTSPHLTIEYEIGNVFRMYDSYAHIVHETKGGKLETQAKKVMLKIKKGELIPIYKIRIIIPKGSVAILKNSISSIEMRITTVWNILRGDDNFIKVLPKRLKFLPLRIQNKDLLKKIVNTWPAEDNSADEQNARDMLNEIIKWIEAGNEKIVQLPDPNDLFNKRASFKTDHIGTVIKQLKFIRDKFIGQSGVKLMLTNILRVYLIGLESIGDVSFNMMFYGNPGTGKK